MIDAKYAREIALDKRDAEYHSLSDRIQNRIMEVSYKGEFKTDFTLKNNEYSEKTIDTVMKHLRINGFSLTIHEYEQHTMIDISWE